MNRKVLISAVLGLVVVLTLAAALYFRHYFVVFFLLAWSALEFIAWRVLFPRPRPGTIRVHSLNRLLDLYGRFDTVSEPTLERTIEQVRSRDDLSGFERRWIDRLKDLVVLRGLLYGETRRGRGAIRQAFAYGDSRPQQFEIEKTDVQQVVESATLVADLYWKLYEVAVGEYPDLSEHARHLYERIFDRPFENTEAREVIERLTDSMQRDHGIPFLILNLIRTENMDWARHIAQSLLADEDGVDELIDQEVRSTLYWITEIHWFTQDEVKLTDFETTIRYLYHLCFTNPERAGFLEIDSQFFAQFEIVNDIAQEGFLFKEILVEKILHLWSEQDVYFNKLFQGVLETMTRRRSKVYDERESWELFWKREKESFSRDYLYVVEGNLSYAKGHFEDARRCYEKALKINPELRSALFNVIFAYEKLGLTDLRDLWIHKIVSQEELMPAALYIAGDCYLLAGDLPKADLYYDQLKRVEGWERKTEHYKSTFCYENGMFHAAVRYAERAHTMNPHDSAISYHLSLCYNALGEKDQALTMVKKMGEAPQWLSYYRFTLERDAGHHQEASATLLQIPQEYFQDPDELAAAVDFAKRQKDLVLLRHLRRRDE